MCNFPVWRRQLAILSVWASLSTTSAAVLSQDDLLTAPAESNPLSSGPDFASIVGLAGEGEESIAGQDEIETDRSSFTPAKTTAGPGRVIFESSYSFLDNRNESGTHSFPEMVLRYGVAGRVELRVQWNYEVGGGTGGVSTGEGESDFEGVRFVRESQVAYGAKVGVTEQSGWLPTSAVLLLGTTPTSGMQTASGFIGTYVLAGSCRAIGTSTRRFGMRPTRKGATTSMSGAHPSSPK